MSEFSLLPWQDFVLLVKIGTLLSLLSDWVQTEKCSCLPRDDLDETDSAFNLKEVFAQG